MKKLIAWLRSQYQTAPLWRGFLEAWLLSSLLLLSIVLFMLNPALQEPNVATTIVLAGISSACAAWAGLRLRPWAGRWNQVAFAEAIGSLFLALGLVGSAMVALTLLNKMDLLQQGSFGVLGSLLVLGSNGFLYLALRLALWILGVWDGLRRRRFLWALTHAHIVLVMVIIGGFFAAIALYNLTIDTIYPPGNGAIHPLFQFSVQALVWLFTWIVLTVGATLASLVVVLPPSALLSYLVARRLTRRLESLTRAADAMRTWDLSVRVPVEGEDEVARLQENFNGMAADLERSTRELQTERDKVSALLQAQRELTATVSHELRTPIATVKGYLDSLLDNWEARPPEELPHDLEVMAHETERLGTLVEDLLTLSRAEVNQLTLELEPVQVKEVAERAVNSLAPLAWEAGRVEVLCEVIGDLPLVRADAGRLEQALLNLLNNGVRHTPPGGIVAVAAESEENAVHLDVIDTGEGISPEVLPHIWQRFYRAGEGHPGNGNGVGLGLALVKELTEAMGGRVAVESTPGEGSRFSICLPRV